MPGSPASYSKSSARASWPPTRRDNFGSPSLSLFRKQRSSATNDKLSATDPFPFGSDKNRKMLEMLFRQLPRRRLNANAARSKRFFFPRCWTRRKRGGVFMARRFPPSTPTATRRKSHRLERALAGQIQKQGAGAATAAATANCARSSKAKPGRVPAASASASADPTAGRIRDVPA